MLFVGVLVLWARSYWITDHWAVQDRATSTAWGASCGHVFIEHTHAIPPLQYDALVGIRRVRLVPVDLYSLRPPGGKLDDLTMLGLRYYTLQKPAEIRRMLLIPYWAVASILLVLPGRQALVCLRRWRRPLPGCCPRCGYDLRATPDRCPECGTAA